MWLAFQHIGAANKRSGRIFFPSLWCSSCVNLFFVFMLNSHVFYASIICANCYLQISTPDGPLQYVPQQINHQCTAQMRALLKENNSFAVRFVHWLLVCSIQYGQLIDWKLQLKFLLSMHTESQSIEFTIIANRSKGFEGFFERGTVKIQQ